MKILHKMLIYAFLSVIIYADHHLYAQEFQKGAKEFLSTKQTLRFEQNVGQYHAIDQQHKNREVKFVLKNGLHKIFLLSNGLAHQFDQLICPKGYDPSASEPKKIEAQEKLAKQVKLNSYRMDMELLGANPHPVITSKGKSAYPERYMNGEVHEAYTWQEITYHDVYPGIDWVLYSKGNELKYDFVVHAGADPSKIKLKLVEAGQSSLEADGSFQWSNPLGWVKENKPLSLQDGCEITSCYQYANGILAFKLGDYDRSKDLLIDPSLQWGTYYGGGAADEVYGVATDGNGNVFIVGSTYSNNGISSPGAHQSSYGGSLDAFVVKFDSNGLRQWCTYYGGSSFDEGYGIATDSFGNVFIVGEAMSTNGISSPGAYQSSNGGSLDAYVAKLNSNGVRQWGTYFGGSGADDGRAIATDVSGNVFITGATYSANRISTPGAHQSSYGGSKDAYIAKFHSNGMRLWSTYYGGSSSDETFGIATDVSGNVLVTGNTYSTNAISTLGVHQTNNGGIVDAFVAKFNNNGVRQWASYYGGSSNDYAEGVAADGSGNVLIAGSTFSTNGIATSGAYQTSGAGSRDAFVAKFKANFPQFRLHPQSAGVNCAYDSMFFNCSVNEPTDSLQWQKYNGSAWVRLKGGQDTFYIPSQNDRNKNGDSIRVLLFVKTLGIASNSAIVQIKGDRPMIAINTTTQPTAGDSDGSIDLDVNGYGSYLRYARWSNSTGHNHPNGADFDLSNAPEGSHYLMLITKEKCVYYEGPYYLGIPK